MIYKELPCYGKINLFLEVYEKNDEGYHNIDSVMQCVSLADILKIGFEEGDKNEVSLSCSESYIPCDERNTAYKAALKFLEISGKTGKVSMHIEKRIPSQAGLGGGSADAAGVILALNELTGAGLGEDALCALGAKIGADVPFCMKRGASVCKGIGDIFTPCKGLPDGATIVIGKGRQGSKTPEAYKALDMIRNRKIAEGSDSTVSYLLSGDIKQIGKSLYNAFEKVVLPINREASKIRRLLSVSGAAGVLMSGSGSAVFGLFTDEEKARCAAGLISSDMGKDKCSVFICKPVGE